jgi:hypothetical protein
MVARFPGRCAMCTGPVDEGDSIVLVKRSMHMNETRHEACLTDAEKSKRRRDARRRARDSRRAFQSEPQVVRLSGSQIELVLANLPEGPEADKIRAAGEEALVEVRERLARRFA